MPGKINHNVKSIRELKNYTQEYMSEKLGMTQAGYSKIEKGCVRMSFEKLEEIAGVFEMSVDSIIQFEIHFFLKAQTNGCGLQPSGFMDVHSLYRDKIGLLEKLLLLTEEELKKYKDKCGQL